MIRAGTAKTTSSPPRIRAAVLVSYPRPSMFRRSHAALGISLLLAATTAVAQSGRPAALTDLKTRAERSNFAETSRYDYDDVVAFLDTVDRASPLVHLTSFGYTFEGRSLPLAIVGRLSAVTPQAIRASSLLRVYIQANIHAGKVEGKEAMLASTEVTPQPFENHQERTVTGKYAPVDRTIPGAYRVPMTQPLARLAFYLLEPRSNDGLVTWNVFDEAIKKSPYPVVRTRN